jgi:hypothetical protein
VEAIATPDVVFSTKRNVDPNLGVAQAAIHVDDKNYFSPNLSQSENSRREGPIEERHKQNQADLPGFSPVNFLNDRVRFKNEPKHDMSKYLSPQNQSQSQLSSSSDKVSDALSEHLNSYKLSLHLDHEDLLSHSKIRDATV